MTGCLDGFVFQTQGAMSFYPEKIRKKSIIIPNAITIKFDSKILLIVFMLLVVLIMIVMIKMWLKD